MIGVLPVAPVILPLANLVRAQVGDRPIHHNLRLRYGLVHVVAHSDHLICGGVAFAQIATDRIPERLLRLAVDHPVRIHAAMLDDIGNKLALMVAERVSWTGQCHARYRPSLSTSASVMISGSLIARRPMRVGVYISGGVTLFDLIRYAADIIRGVFGVFGFNLDCDFHGSRLLASCCNRVDRRRRPRHPLVPQQGVYS